MYTKPDGHLLRSELALISNMARTIKDPAEKSRLMTEYDEILKAIEQLPNMFGSCSIALMRSSKQLSSFQTCLVLRIFWMQREQH